MRRRERIAHLAVHLAALATVVALGACASHRGANRTANARGGCTSAERDGQDVQVGYGAQPRRQLSVSVGSVTLCDVESLRVTYVEELLEGRVPGVQLLRRPGGQIAVRIRGAGGIDGNGQPLYVIDGMPVAGSSSSPLAGMSPLDVERIDVLKDGGSTAIYGSQAMNGVIIVKTRRAN